jgi:cysteine desulfurase/selenocysteine lyase
MQATRRYDEARARIAQAIGAAEAREVIFVRGATEAINLVAQCFLRSRLQEGDEILLTEMEHHANIIPWQLVASATGATVKAIPITDEGVVDLEAAANMMNERTRMLAFAHISNVLGTINPAKELVSLAKAQNIPVLVDGAQAIPHGPVDVQSLGADFYTFSGHKVYGPDGIGVLYGHTNILNAMPPYQGGGDMIERVQFEGSTFRDIPERFEAGTPNISAAISLAVAFDYLESLGWESIQAHETTLLHTALERLAEVPGITLYGPTENRASVVSFAIKDVHPHDIGTFLDGDGIAIRVGHHCAQPLMDRLGVAATTRASFALYNTIEEIDKLVAALLKVQRFFG